MRRRDTSPTFWTGDPVAQLPAGQLAFPGSGLSGAVQEAPGRAPEPERPTARPMVAEPQAREAAPRRGLYCGAACRLVNRGTMLRVRVRRALHGPGAPPPGLRAAMAAALGNLRRVRQSRAGAACCIGCGRTVRP